MEEVVNTLAPAEPVQVTEDAALDAAYDKAMAMPDEPVEAPEVPVEVPQEPVAETPVVDEAPTDLPAKVRANWASIPAEAREEIKATQQKLAAQGRLVAGINPIKDALVEATQKLPFLKDMRPEQVAKEVFQMAEISARFGAKPVETLVGLIQKHNLASQVMQHLGGQSQQPQEAQLLRQIAELKQELASVRDPRAIESTVETVLTRKSMTDTVQDFAASAEHWKDVEEHIPQVIPLVRQKLGPDAPPKEVLSESYKMALSFFAPDKVTPPAPVASPPVSDPKADAALKAKSVNVVSRDTGKAREMTEDELLDAAWDRAHKRK